MTSLLLTRSDVSIITHAVVWLMDIPFQHSNKPILAPRESNLLLDVYNHFLTYLNSEAPELRLEIARRFHPDSARLHITKEIASLILTALTAFRAELWDMENEIEIITGSPREQLSELIPRFQEVLQVGAP